MPKPDFLYKKKDAFRDASLFIIVCEGQSREPDYFNFFNGISSRVKIIVVPSEDGKSAPQHLIANARGVEKEIELKAGNGDQIWFVIDTDRWRAQIHTLRNEADNTPYWHICQSNPCFEVWLYYHFRNAPPQIANLGACNSWKPHLPEVITGGFDSGIHPVLIEDAIENSRTNCIENGYSPNPGSTQIWRLAELLLPLINKDVAALRKKLAERL